VNIPLAFRRIQAANLADWSGVLPNAEFDQLARAVSDLLSDAPRLTFEETARPARAATVPIFQEADDGRPPAGPSGSAKAERAHPQKAEQERLVREAETKREPYPAVAQSDVPPLFGARSESILRKRVIIFGLPAVALIGILIYTLTLTKQVEKRTVASERSPRTSTAQGGVQGDAPSRPIPAAPAKVEKVIPRHLDEKEQVRPNAISKEIADTNHRDLPSADARRSAVGGEPGGGNGSVSSAAPPSSKMKASTPLTPQRIRVGGNVQQANLIRKVQPVYPPLAKQARIQGTVRFTAIIGTDGTIQNLQLVTGHPLLVEAARQSVIQWQYKPTLVNSEPVEVVTQIDVNFTLSQ
jgi:protein TonB